MFFHKDDQNDLPCLPSQAPDPASRQKSLEKARQEYQFDQTYLAPLPMMYVNTDGRVGNVEGVLGVFALPKSARAPEAYSVGRAEALAEVPLEALRTHGESKEPTFPALSGFASLLKGFPMPAAISPRPDDIQIVAERLAGVNPVMISRLSEWPANYAFTNENLKHVLGEITLEEALAEGDLYVCDYHLLESPTPLPMGTSEVGPRYVRAVIALFMVVKTPGITQGQLVLLGIQTGQTSDDVVVTPRDGAAWVAAKHLLQVADFNYHEMVTHLCHTHFCEEGIAVATARSLYVNHPIAVLLAPHFAVLLFNNFEGRELLVNPGGPVSTILAPTLDGSLDLVKRGYAVWNWDNWCLPKALEKRGVGPSCSITNYPYRDDALLLWDAISRYVSNYVAIYYPNDATVATDVELQYWINELTSLNGAHVPGLDPELKTVAQLEDMLTRIIFTAGPQHSAVNYAQYDFMAYVPQMAGAVYGPVPTSLKDLNLQGPLQYLPPPGAAAVQSRIIYELTSYRYDKLGDYAASMVDPQAKAVVEQFYAQLQEIDKVIAARETTGRSPYPYPYLQPSLVLNSTSI